MRRPVVALLYIALFASELAWAGIAPLIPSFADRFALNDVQSAAILAVASLGILVVSLPAGTLTRHVDPKRFTVASVAVIVLGDVLIGVAGTYGVLLVGRLVVGLGFGGLWVAGAAWLHDAAGDHSAAVLSLTTAVVGLGSLLGPAFTGTLADRAGDLGIPFLVLGGLLAVVLVALSVERSGTGRALDQAPPLRTMLRAASADAFVRVCVAVTLMSAIMWLSADLLVPLRLSAAGYSAGAIGLAFSASSIVFVACSAVVGRHGERYASIEVAAVSTSALAIGLLVPVASGSTVATVAFLLLASAITGVMVAIAFPLGVVAARRGFVTIAMISALLNIVWAVSGLFGPTLGGAVRDVAGDRVAFAVLAAFEAIGAWWMWRAVSDARASVAVSTRADT